MEYRDAQGNTFELPTYTMELQSRFDQAADYRKQYALMAELFPADYLAERVGESLETCSVPDLAVLFTEIRAAYIKPMLEAQMSSLTEVLDQVGKVADTMAKVQELTKRKGFSRVK